jgi:hypothetical protein
VVVDACFDGSISVDSGQDIELSCGWGAKTKGQLNEFLTADIRSFTLTNGAGIEVASLDATQAATYWRSPITLPASIIGLECVREDTWAMPWRYPLGVLDDGIYMLTWNEALTHPVNDGMHTCSIDGERIPPPSLYPAGPLPTVVMTIVVS